MSGRSCEVPGDNHSDDMIVAVWHGKDTPTYMCGFHCSEGRIRLSFKEIDAAKG